MEESTLYGNFYVGLGIAVILILTAAVLLILVILAAKRILRLATAALGLVEQIKENTNSIWGLKTTNQVATDILQGATDIDSHTELVVEALLQSRKN